MSPVRPWLVTVAPKERATVSHSHTDSHDRGSATLSHGQPRSLVLDWHRHRTGPLAPCRYCGRKAFCRDDENKPAHKVCIEQRTTSTTPTGATA